jgi:hypothetical protein
MTMLTPPDAGNEAHYATCSLHHETTISSTCYALLRNGDPCSARATPDPEAHQLPVCDQHKAQIQPYALCAAALPCGSTCGAVFAWASHGFRLCSWHEGDARPPCLLQQLPPEVRRMIWALVVLERPAVEHVAGAAGARRASSKRLCIAVALLGVWVFAPRAT